MSAIPTHIDFRANTQHVAPGMPASVRKATARFLGTRAAVVDVVGEVRWQTLRQAGHDIRLHTINHLDYYLTLLEERVTQAGGFVHWARDPAEARRIVLEIAQQHQVKRAVKAKSMATEEIGLNHALIEAGIQTLETDLGEFIVQLAGTGPSHIIVPAVHLTKEDIADLFHEKLGVDASPDPLKLAALARAKLRAEFLAADMGITGANFLVAETGTLVMVTNEGNGRMSTTLPPLHVAVAGIDKIVPDMESLNVLLKLLPRSATGQKMSAYTTFITGPRRTDEEQGAREFHLVLLDNGRTRMLQDPVTRETLLCIRCGACLNVCPVYNNVGGHAYGFAYSGPIGAILSPQLLGTRVAAALPFASSLCGACADICPVKIPIVEILLRLRRRVVEGDAAEAATAPPAARIGSQAMARAMSIPALYRIGAQALQIAQAPFRRENWLPNLPPPINRWTMTRPLPAIAPDFRAAWRNRTLEGRRRERGIRIGMAAAVFGIVGLVGWLLSRRRR
ncbi:MAG: iron-sulfur cluster-binding protein [Chloroflexi bacterium]|nr:iron-sulfur cluster-binding protein [Chloroflexota bacterium]